MKLPVGTILSMIADKAPPDTMRCEGQTLKCEDYPELAAVFGDRNGDGTFTLPDENQLKPLSFSADAKMVSFWVVSR